MKSSALQYCLREKKVYLSTGEKVEYWGNGLLFIFIAGMILFVDIQEDLHTGRFPIASLLLAGIAAVLVMHKIHSIKFEIWKLNVSDQQFMDACMASSIFLDWHLLVSKDNYVIASKEIAWQWEGIRITAIRTDNEIYFNSMPAPSIRSGPFSFGWNKKNQDEFRKNLLSAMEGQNVVQEARVSQERRDEQFWNESEWTFTNSLKRIIGYGLAIPFLIIGIWMISIGASEGFIPGLMIIFICSYYIYYDIRIILLKRKRRK